MIAPSSVISLKAPHAVVDNQGRLSVDLVGTGEITVFQKGKAIEGTWERDSRQSNFVFKNTEGEEIKLNPGMTWVTVSPIDSAVVYF